MYCQERMYVMQRTTYGGLVTPVKSLTMHGETIVEQHDDLLTNLHI